MSSAEPSSLPNEAQRAVQLFVEACEVKKTNSSKQKEVTARQDAAKEALMSYMQTRDLPFITVAENCYLILKKKTSKPSLGGELLPLVYTAFQESKGRDVAPSEGVEFSAFLEQQQVRLSSSSVDLVVSTSKPLSSMF